MPLSYRPLPTLSRLQALLLYFPETGLFVWKKTHKLAGAKPSVRGYGRIRVDDQLCTAHRLAWYMYHAEDPLEKEIDHINGNKMDNRIGNLRLAIRAENSRNEKIRGTNTSGYKGVSWMKNYGKWEAYIWRNYKKHRLGYFDTAEEAAMAVEAVRASFHLDFANHG